MNEIFLQIIIQSSTEGCQNEQEMQFGLKFCAFQGKLSIRYEFVAKKMSF